MLPAREKENEKEKEKEGCTAQLFASLCLGVHATLPAYPTMLHAHLHTAQHGCMHALHGCVLWCVLRCVPALHHACTWYNGSTPVLLLPRPSAHSLSASLRPAPPSHARRTLATRTPSGVVVRRRAFVKQCAHCPFPFPCFCFSTCQYSVVLSVCFTTTTSYRPAT